MPSSDALVVLRDHTGELRCRPTPSGSAGAERLCGHSPMQDLWVGLIAAHSACWAAVGTGRCFPSCTQLPLLCHSSPACQSQPCTTVQDVWACRSPVSCSQQPAVWHSPTSSALSPFHSQPSSAI